MPTLTLTTVSLSLAMTIQTFYANTDAASLRALCQEVADQETALLCAYRLYPLTQDADLLTNLPREDAATSARSLALLSGLWGYKAAQASLPALIRAGRRSTRFLEAARAQDPNELYLLLIEGQSLLFRPAFVGGDPARALRLFQELRPIVALDSSFGISLDEVDLWIWYTLDTLGDVEAPVLHARLLTSDLPPVYRTFLLSPPRP